MELSDTTIKDANRTEATKSITTSIRTNEIVLNARLPTTFHTKKPLPTVVIKPRKVRLNIGANRNHQVLVSGRRQYRSIPTVGSQPPQTRRPPTTHTSSIPNTNFDIDDDDDNHSISKNNNDSEFDDDDVDNYIANTVESLETYVAIQSLQQSIETCIVIPMVASSQSNFAGGTGSLSTMTSTSTMDHIRGVLECQILEYFSSLSVPKSHDTIPANAASIQKCSISRQKIQKQLQHLQQQNVITCIPILQQETSHMLYVFTKHYTQYILEQHEHFIRNDATTTTVTIATTTTSIDRPNSILLLQWWIRQLLSKTNTIGTNGTPYITVFDIEQAWCNDTPSHHSSFLQQHHIASAATQSSLLNVQTIVQYLQDAQLILSASYDHSTYQLWLPNVWGTMVLPKLLQLCKDVVLYIKRSSYHERSVTSIRERFPIYHAPPMQRPQGTCLKQIMTTAKKSDANIYISIENIIIPYLVAQRRVQRLERPSGMCLKLLE